MAKGLNKHTPDSEELLKRLNSNDSSGLDDFEKEALEGFDSLDNAELAKNLTDSVNRKIDEKYFEKQGGKKNGMLYLSLAAGLVVVVGLSVFFMNIMGDQKEVAMSPDTKTTEQIANEVAAPADVAPLEEATKTGGKGGDVNTITTTDALAENTANGGGKDIPESVNRKKTEADKDDGLTSRMVVKESKPEQSVADNEGELKKQAETKTTSGPPAGNTVPASPSFAMDDQKPKDKEEEKNEKISSSKNNNSDANSQALSGKESGVKKRAAPKKEKAKSGEALGSEDVAANDESTVNKPVNVASQTAATGGVAVDAKESKRDESGYFHSVEYSNHAYYKPQDYIKVEINKSEMLKTNVKAFKAELSINEKGTVTSVKFLTEFGNCTGCKKELEKILLNMPGWKPKTKSVVETVSYIDQ